MDAKIAADDVFFDERRHRIYVSCGSGSVAVLTDRYGGYRNISLSLPVPGEAPLLFVPELDRLFVGSSPRASVCWGGRRRS